METTDMDDNLNGIPNLGPARRTALEAAGITTRAQLAQASAEQLVGMTGMARSLAEKTLEFVRHAAAPATNDQAAAASLEAEPFLVAPAAAEAPVPDQPPPASEPEDGDPNANVATNLEQQVLRAQTALSDLTRLVGDKGGKEFSREAERLSNVLDALPGSFGAVSKPKRLRRLAAEVETTAAQIELLAQSEAKTGKKAQQRYTAILRDDRKVLEAKVLEAKAGKTAEAAPPPPKKKTNGGKKPGKKK